MRLPLRSAASRPPPSSRPPLLLSPAGPALRSLVRDARAGRRPRGRLRPEGGGEGRDALGCPRQRRLGEPLHVGLVGRRVAHPRPGPLRRQARRAAGGRRPRRHVHASDPVREDRGRRSGRRASPRLLRSRRRARSRSRATGASRWEKGRRPPGSSGRSGRTGGGRRGPSSARRGTIGPMHGTWDGKALVLTVFDGVFIYRLDGTARRRGLALGDLPRPERRPHAVEGAPPRRGGRGDVASGRRLDRPRQGSRTPGSASRSRPRPGRSSPSTTRS